MSKTTLRAWSRGQKHLAISRKALLLRLVDLAHPETYEVWPLNRVLQAELNASRRFIQEGLRALEQDGLISKAGRAYRLKNGRQVPVYRVAPELAPPSATEAGAPDALVTSARAHPNGRTPARPHNERKRKERSSTELPPPALNSTLFLRALAVFPERGRLHTNAVEAAQLWITISQAVGEEALFEAVKRHASAWERHPDETGPPGFQRWLREGRYQPWLRERRETSASPSSRLPDEFLSAFCLQWSDKENSVLSRCSWEEDTRTLRPFSSWGWNWLRGHALFLLRAHGMNLGAPLSTSPAGGAGPPPS